MLVKKTISKSVDFTVLAIACVIGASISINSISIDLFPESNQNKEKQAENQIEEKLARPNTSPQPTSPQGFGMILEGDYPYEEAEKIAMNWYSNIYLDLPVNVEGSVIINHFEPEMRSELLNQQIRVGEHIFNFDPDT